MSDPRNDDIRRAFCPRGFVPMAGFGETRCKNCGRPFDQHPVVVQPARAELLLGKPETLIRLYQLLPQSVAHGTWRDAAAYLYERAHPSHLSLRPAKQLKPALTERI